MCVQRDAVAVSNIERSRMSALIKWKHQSSHVPTSKLSWPVVTVKDGTTASTLSESECSGRHKPCSIYSGHETNLSWCKGKKWGMGAAKRSAPPPGLMETCQDPITILSSAFNVWMTVPHKGNKAPRFHSVVKANVRVASVVVTKTIRLLFRCPQSNSCTPLRLNWPFWRMKTTSCYVFLSPIWTNPETNNVSAARCQFLPLVTNNEDFYLIWKSF